jgi:AraC family transcriptional regulator
MPIQGQNHGNLKYPGSTLLRSSEAMGWSNLFADFRSHRSGEGGGALGPHVEISMIVRGAPEGLVTCKVGGARKPVRPTPGTIWLNPIGAMADEIRIASPELHVLHLYVPRSAFTRLSEDYDLPRAPGPSIHYSSGVHDDVIHQIGLSVLAELERPTAAGRMLVETSSLFLAARLLHAHCEMATSKGSPGNQRPLDKSRLVRVLAYIEEHLEEDVAVADLAGVACLSVFHFTRAFTATVGVAPHRYLSQRRLEAAKARIADGKQSLCEIALAYQFSSQSSFTRAFRRATGLTPAEYRRKLR